MDSIRASRVPPPHLRFEPMARALGGRQRPHPLSGSGKAMMLNAFVPEDAAKSRDWSSCFTDYQAGQAREGMRRETVGRCP